MDYIILLDALLLVILLVIGVPVPLCFAGAAIFLVLVGDIGSPTFLIPVGLTKLSSLVLLAIPLYILAGDIITRGGIATRLVDLAEAVVGRMKGGLSLVVVITTAIFGAISGMATSAVATIGSILIPRMVERGYDRGYATALVACSSVLALLIPPSSSMILYGWVTDTSILAVFLAPILPAFILIVAFYVVNLVVTRKMPISLPEKQKDQSYAANVMEKSRKASFALLMPLIILGCIYGGVTTPTEAAAIAIVYSVPVGFFIYKKLTPKGLYASLWVTAKISGAVMMLVFFSSMLARLFTMENVPQDIMQSLMQLSDNPLVILLLINVFLIVVGMLMDDISGVLLASPLLLPVIQELGVHPVQFGAIIAVNLGMGLVTPPTAPILYFAGLVGKARIQTMIKPTLAFVFFAYLPVVLLTTFIPDLSLWLPRLILGIE